MNTFFWGILPFVMILVFSIAELGQTEKEGGSQSPKSHRGQ